VNRSRKSFVELAVTYSKRNLKATKRSVLNFKIDFQWIMSYQKKVARQKL
jgi:hypothetical protein